MKEARLRAGLTLQQLGEKIGTDKGTMSRIESGRARIGSEMERASAIARALGVELTDLLSRSKRAA